MFVYYSIRKTLDVCLHHRLRSDKTDFSNWVRIFLRLLQTKEVEKIFYENKEFLCKLNRYQRVFRSKYSARLPCSPNSF